MNTNQIIKEEIDNYNNSLDLSDIDSINRWILNNGPESLFTDDGELDLEYTDPMTGDDLETLIYSYMENITCYNVDII